MTIETCEKSDKTRAVYTMPTAQKANPSQFPYACYNGSNTGR